MTTSAEKLEIIERAIRNIDENSMERTDGKWLEDLTVQVAPHVSEWDIDECYLWSDWPERNRFFRQATNRDIGIDAVGVRQGSGEYIAIQCKSRVLDENERGNPITKEEVDSFMAASAGTHWTERWIVTNGDVSLGQNAISMTHMDEQQLKETNIKKDLRKELADLAHSYPPPPYFAES